CVLFVSFVVDLDYRPTTENIAKNRKISWGVLSIGGDCCMAYESLAAFFEELASAGELARVRAPVDPILEIAEITDRISKAHGPALLFENVIGSPYPLAINVL